MIATLNSIEAAASKTAAKYSSINRIGIFGSYARGDYDGNSDLDILYDYNYNLDDATDQILSFIEDFLEMVKPLKVDFVWERNLLKRDDDFKNNVLRDLVWIYHTPQSPVI
ncbi:MAG: nucleotidyltransferase domain-containing protein [Defluviitaleaceae bacterium]|nr:nucleotidyltransferase domain-containing protein [Defluviitaleaceae bacterium]